MSKIDDSIEGNLFWLEWMRSKRNKSVNIMVSKVGYRVSMFTEDERIIVGNTMNNLNDAIASRKNKFGTENLINHLFKDKAE